MPSMDASATPLSSSSVQLSRQHILDATARCFDEHGYDGTTIRRIALILGCAVGSIYRYFSDKRDLLNAVTQRQLEAVVVLINSGASFTQSVQLYVRRAEASPQMYRLMFWLVCVNQDPEASQDRSAGSILEIPGIPQARSTSVALGIPAVVTKIIAGWAQRLGDAQLAEQCWAILHGLMMLGHDGDHAVRAALALTNGCTDLHAPSLHAPHIATPGQTVLNAVMEQSEHPATVAPASTDDRMDLMASSRVGAAQVQDAADTSSDDVCLL